MWVLIWAALLFSLTERATCRKLAAPPTASLWNITFSPAEITAEKGLCAVISCTFTHPDNINPTTAIWFKDENIILHSKKPSKAQEGFKQRVSLLEPDLTKKNCSVIINDIRENDAGEYQFRLPKTYTYLKKVKITVSALTQKPSVLIPPLTEGEPATLTCIAPGICSGTPPHITWTWRGTGDNITELRDNTTIQMREDLTNVTTTHFSTLTFTPSAEHHNMMVTCQVTFQKKYQIEETVTLNVTYVKDPQITGNKMVKEDGILDLTCSVDSYPPSDITWSKNGTSAPLQNYTENAALTISNVTREHAGNLLVMWTPRNLKLISCTFTHPDNIKPTAAIWFKCPTKDRCDKDENIIFHSKEPSKAQEGFKQRVSLLETDLTKKNCSVIINDIRENDAGEYQFRLPKTYTYLKKVKITVSALIQKPSVLIPPLTEGEPATLTCTAPGICSGTPPHITWTWRGTGDNITELRDNTTIQMREDLTIDTTTHFSTLTFTPSAKHHGTNVTCLVTFNGSITTKKTLTMNVAHVKKPTISGCNTVREGDTLNLTCSVDSYPPSSSNITWSKKGTTALEQNNSGLATVIISNMTREHAGEYVCTAQHHKRSLTASTVVTVMLNSTISLPVRSHTNTTVECVSRNEAGRVREKLQVTQIKKQEKQEEDVSKDIMAMLSDLKVITAFVVGAALSATICCIFLCLNGKCKRRKEKIPKDSDSKSPFMNLEMVTCEDQQIDAGQAVGGKQTPLQLELREGAENGGPQTSGAAGKFATGEELNDVDYARINYSLLKKKTPEEAEKKTTTTETDYAEIKREKKNEEEEDGGEGSGGMEEVEWEEGEEMIGTDEEKENDKPLRETDEDTALYSNVKAIMGEE